MDTTLVCGTTVSLNISQLLDKIDAFALAVETGVNFLSQIETENIGQAIDFMARGAKYLHLPFADRLESVSSYVKTIDFDKLTDQIQQYAHAIRQFTQNVDRDSFQKLVEALATGAVMKIVWNYRPVLSAFSKYIGPLLMGGKTSAQEGEKTEIFMEMYYGIKLFQLIGQWIKRRREKNAHFQGDSMDRGPGEFLLSAAVDPMDDFDFASVNEISLEECQSFCESQLPV